MYTILFLPLLTLLSTLTLTTALPPRPKSKYPLPYHHPIARSTCPTTHLPTTAQYQSALSSYCAHFPDSLTPQKPLVYTYELTDGRGYPIKWILSTTWDDNGNRANGGSEGVMTVQQDSCEEWFRALENACEGGLMQGGKTNVLEGRVKGAKVWVETRQMNGDSFVPPQE
ncbi:hypothetical protein L13192_10487 [Pyrenophora tritici-repentis]|uniref:Uncharacterized protein n=2 Tax=Pyrenophora tritici-repentis TaxID=45151 RepID=A0A922N7J1_9PLEO|nr:uncharacterized protein PTRG_06617 [Pyrenophora tritici-repentis Pt-1C-BFP]EDU49537.1 predicted protein [Pyrenophora tritici-repentis Pt-1C-BFP]KAI1512749.1 hypothetical protein Ptr86124_008715 [Pyrenophora tritici-repentis]KAI1665546.1 hypothetical protein L13192_10487 [Pyrenophora tritici-repentis]KAI1677621.1 hypothetical protein KJE20_12557 [Pyrenophora tritici-repentis]